ncbi:MAG TPA: SRPBCC domain-containing protein [Nitriliruptorales bacterium]|nr:SRPBCC domain-containing protein [Nitriliruptorales bacterium]
MTDPPVVRVERHVHAPPSAVFAYLTASDGWARWQGDEASIHPTPGGIFRILMGTGETARGQFVEVVPDHKVVFTLGWLDRPGIPPGSTVVEIELLPEADGTLIRLTHRQLPPDESAMHRAGWQHYLERLATVASGRDPGPDHGVTNERP